MTTELETTLKVTLELDEDGCVTAVYYKGKDLELLDSELQSIEDDNEKDIAEAIADDAREAKAWDNTIKDASRQDRYI